MTPERAREIAARLFAFADPTRLLVVAELAGGERTPTALAAAVGRSPELTLAHLRRLRAAGVVTARAVGRQSVYALSDPQVADGVLLLAAGGVTVRVVVGGREESGRAGPGE